MKKVVVLGCLLLGTIAACIPVIDRFAPEIEVLTPLAQSYFIQDTIKVVFSFGDNDRLDSAVVSIRKTGDVSGSGQIWNPTFNRKLRGRRFEDTLRIPIPATAQPGAYEMSIRLFDFSGNQTAQQLTFNVLGDQRPPVIINLDLVGLQRDAAGNYLICRQTLLNLTGRATDNLRIREVRAEIAGIFNLTRLVNSDIVNFDNLFDQNLRIPANIADNTRLLLVISVTDQGNNTVNRSFNLLLSCDDEAPQIRVQTTAPQINEKREATVIEGDDFRILSGTVTDNRRLGRLVITFNAINARRDTVFRANLSGTTAQLGNLLANQRFQPPADAVAGSSYEINLFATDSAGNKAQPFRLVLNITKDEPPQLLLTEARIRGELTTLSSTTPTPLPVGAELLIFGKIVEDRALEYVQIFWGPEQRPERVVNLTAQQLTPLPFDLADPNSVNRFVITERAAAASRNFVLQFRIKDTRNPEVVQTFRFVVP
ncbi:DUF4625 domain-containing protein [Rhodoflexus sp.]